MRSYLQAPAFVEVLLLAVVSALLYLVFVPWFGYFNDDWYLMYAAGAKGPAVFWDVFAVDRPLRALVMIPAYMLFGANPLYYNLGAFVFRLAGGLAFLWIVRTLWPGKNRETLWMATLFLLYPGFLSQPNAIDYFCHLVGLAAGLFSIGLTLQAVHAQEWKRRVLLYGFSILLGWFYLGQIEWYIGLEFFRFACVFLSVLRRDETMWVKGIRFSQYILPVFLIPVVFLVWRLFYFSSARGATDVGLQLGEVRADPLGLLPDLWSAFWNDMLDVFLRAWWQPLHLLSTAMDASGWMAGIGFASLVLFLYWSIHRRIRSPESEVESAWQWQVVWIGLGVALFGLFPVILVGRSVDFKFFSRYTLIASIGPALLWPAMLSFVSNTRARNLLLSLLLVSASLTHYMNGVVAVRKTQSMERFWWQVSWRVPQFQQGTTLIADYPAITIEEDYFVWGPASLIYYPDSMHADYPQPGVYALLINDDTVANVLARKPQEFSDRRSIVTYPNHRNILIITQPTLESCVHVIDGRQPEFSSSEDERFVQIGPYSEVGLVLEDESFRNPPMIPFGNEPPHDWCFYYEKAAFARQVGDWGEVIRLGQHAFDRGLSPKDQVEWMPFLQAYAISGDLVRLRDVDVRLTDPFVRRQVCTMLVNTGQIPPEIRPEAQNLFCS